MKEGTKNDKDKVRYELISTIAIRQKTLVLMAGVEEYGLNNWRAGMTWSRLIGAIFRHLIAYMSGETLDPKSGLSHMAHIACDADFLVEYETTHNSFDDRDKVTKT